LPQSASARLTAIVAGRSVRANKSLGQHFLHDSVVVAKIMAALDAHPNDRILEIGPGSGSLTRHLASTGGIIQAIELDERLASKLQIDFQDYPNVTITQASALDIDPCLLFSQGSESGAAHNIKRQFKVVGNIPYYITGALVRHYLEGCCPAERIVMMVQREVADRIVAGPGDMSILAVATQFYATASIVARVPATSFRPRPKVASAVIQLTPRQSGHVPVPDTGTFFNIVKAGFSSRRKQLVNSLSHGLGLSKDDTVELLKQAHIPGTSRAEDLSIENWADLAYGLAASDTAGSSTHYVNGGRNDALL
jgi:16S rRNA (adenine1518-N6/adenine1519-N6)-dimethyltransferase